MPSVKFKMILCFFERKAHQQHPAAVVNACAAHSTVYAEDRVDKAGKTQNLHPSRVARAEQFEHRAFAFKGELLRHEQDHTVRAVFCELTQERTNILCFAASGAAENQMEHGCPPFRACFMRS